MIGVEKYVHQIQIITNIHSGFSFNYSNLGTIKIDKAESICTLIQEFEKTEMQNVNAVCDDNIAPFSAAGMESFPQKNNKKFYYNID